MPRINQKDLSKSTISLLNNIEVMLESKTICKGHRPTFRMSILNSNMMFKDEKVVTDEAFSITKFIPQSVIDKKF